MSLRPRARLPLGGFLLLAVLAAWLLSGCLQPDSVECRDRYCPAGLVCSPDGDRCVSPAELSACDGKPERAACSVPGARVAACVKGVCITQDCGDGIVSGDEVCDDGNAHSCDGCSADCRSDETCGNGSVDCEEQCDLGSENSDDPNRLCRPDCRRQRCGDGVLDDDSGEDCDGAATTEQTCRDYGFYGGELSCSAACRNDTSSCVGSCGDGEVSGLELCDGKAPTVQSCLDFGYDVGNLRCSDFCTPGFERCERLGFQPMNLDLGVFLIWIWGSAADDVYAVGDTGTILHYDGVAWEALELELDSESRVSLESVWGSAADDVYVVGDEGTILHFDGASWQTMESGTTEGLKRVWGRASDDVYAVGDAGTILHFDGAEWSSQSSPSVTTLWSVWGSDADELFAVGDDGVFYFDGAEWSQADVPAFAYYGVSGVGDGVYAAGDGGTLARFDGASWAVQDTGLSSGYLQGIWGTSERDLYVSGSSGVILHSDGRSFTRVASNTVQDLFAVWGSGPEEVFAVGPSTVVRFGQSGPTLRLVDSGTTEELYSIWGTSMSEVTAVGAAGTIQHFDGESWSTLASPTAEALNWIWGSASDDQFAVGSAGAILHYDGESWTAMESPTEVVLNAVWGSGPRDVFAVGEDGTIVHYDGERWSMVESGTDAYLYNLWGSGKDDVFVAGSGGVILRYDGARFEAMQTDSEAEFWGIWGSGPNDVFALADIDGVYHYDGVSWQKLTTAPSQVLDYASGSSSTDVFALASFASSLFHYDGLDWAPLRLPAASPALFGVWMERAGGYLVGAFGGVIRIDRHCAARENNCGDRWDNDCDGLSNCADPDCAGDTACRAGGYCERATDVECGAKVSGDTRGSRPVFEVYACSERVERGPERVYRLVAPVSGEITVELDDGGRDLDLLVLGASKSGGCDPRGQCLAASAPNDDDVGRVSFSATRGDAYYLIVDGAELEGGEFSFGVRCP